MQQEPTKGEEVTRKRFRISDALAGAIIAAAATLAVAGLTVISGRLSSDQAREQSCIARIDSQEAIFRKKAATVLGSLGEMLGAAATSEGDRTAYNVAAQKVIKASYELTAYTGPTKLGLNALKIAEATIRAVSVETEEQKQAAIVKTGSTYGDWPDLYVEVLNSYEHKRELCRN